MKRLICIFVFVIASTTCFAFQNEPDGFRGIKWGTDISNAPNLVFLRDYSGGLDGIKIYINRDDEQKIGGADVREIEYYFWDDKFYKISTSTSDLLNSGILQHSCIDKFGDQIDFIASSYIWKGQITKINVTKPDYNGNWFWMESVSISKKLDVLTSQKNRERAAKGF